MKFCFSKKIIFTVLAISTLAILLAYLLTEEKRREISFVNRPILVARDDGPSPIQDLVMGNVAAGEAFDKLIKQGVITVDDLERLDFSQEGEPGYGTNWKWGVYKPGGRLFPQSKGGAAVEPWRMAALTGEPNARAIFNLRRYTDTDGKSYDALYLIIPDIRKEQCLRYFNPHQDPSIEAIISVDGPLEIAPNNRNIIVDSFYLPNPGRCIAPQGLKIYLFLPFYARPVEQ